MAERIPQSVTYRVAFLAFLSDGVTAATGKTIAITLSKNGAAFGNPSGGATNATEIASGWYYVDLSTTDSGTVGPLVVHGTAAGVDAVDILFNVTADANTWADALLDRSAGVETGLTVRQGLRLFAAALLGKVSGAAANTPVFRDTADSKNRITATTDASGNRTTVTLDAS